VGAPRSRSRQRISSVLSFDISKSFDHALRNDFEVNYDWKNAGLNLIAQWGKAFGGWEGRDREGDAIWLEFEQPGDPAVLCAAAVQQHALALRSTAVPSLWWGFRVAIDEGPMRMGDGGNTIGLCLDRVSKLAKVRKDDDESIERVLVTPDAARLCSPTLREPQLMARFREEVELEQVDLPGARFVPCEVDAVKVLRELCARVSAVAAEITANTTGTQTDLAPITVENSPEWSPAKAELG
jgi:hypothetical protein